MQELMGYSINQDIREESARPTRLQQDLDQFDFCGNSGRDADIW